MTMTSRWALLRGDGSVEQIFVPIRKTPTQAGLNPDGHAEVKLKRFGDLRHERPDPKTGKWTSDPELKAGAVDDAHLANHGALSIVLARHLKLLEARVMVAGVEIDGSVAREARTLGMAPVDRARQVVDAADAEPDHEYDRILAKHKARTAKH